MQPVDTLIRYAGEEVDRSAFGGKKVDERDLGKCEPGCSEGDVVEKVLRECWCVDGREDACGDGDIEDEEDQLA